MSLGTHTGLETDREDALVDGCTSAQNSLQTESHASIPRHEEPLTPYEHQLSMVPSIEGDMKENDEKPGEPPLGIPSRKKSIDWKDIAALAISLVAFALAVASVASNTISWHLGLVYQLVVAGFLLSVMNLCLNTVAPFLFLLLEARFGPSTLQNYNGILGGQIFNSQLSITWRLIFCGLLSIPMGLSAAYKIFVGGQSSMIVHVDSLVNTSSIFGWASLPGLHNTGFNTGITLFSNATQPYAAASAPMVKTYQLISEPDVPEHAQAYGANLLVLSNTSSAMLDLPRAPYILGLQESLVANETYTLKASIHGTVAKLNDTFHSTSDNSLFYTYCMESSTYGCCKMMYNFWGLNFYPNDGTDVGQSTGFIGFVSYRPTIHLPTCGALGHFFKQYHIGRYPCYGDWNVTKNSIELVKGHCEEFPLPPSKQLWITTNELALVNWYLLLLVEFLGQFSELRPHSPWYNISTATAMAAMIWSRVADLNIGDGTYTFPEKVDPNHNGTFSEGGMMYKTPSLVVSHRATLIKSGWLYCIFGIQPLFTILVLGLTIFLHSVPISKGFGLITILAGIQTQTLHILQGASLSGELREKVRISMWPQEADIDLPVLEYHISQLPVREKNGKLTPHKPYF